VDIDVEVEIYEIRADSVGLVKQDVRQNGTSAGNGDAANGETGDQTADEQGDQPVDSTLL
jgi:hypothetical protein